MRVSAPRLRNRECAACVRRCSDSVRPTTLMTARRVHQALALNDLCARLRGVPQFVNRFNDCGRFISWTSNPWPMPRSKRDGQFAAKMFAKFLQTIENQQVAVEPTLSSSLGNSSKPESLKNAESVRPTRVQEIRSRANKSHPAQCRWPRLRHGEFEIGQLLQFVRRPVTEIQRTGRAELKRIAGRGDVIQMQFRAAVNQPFAWLRFEFASAAASRFDGSKKSASRMHATFTAST